MERRISPSEMHGFSIPKSEGNKGEEERVELLINEIKTLFSKGRITKQEMQQLVKNTNCEACPLEEAEGELRVAIGLYSKIGNLGVEGKGELIRGRINDLNKFGRQSTTSLRRFCKGESNISLQVLYALNIAGLVRIPVSHFTAKRKFELVYDPNEEWYSGNLQRQEATRDKWVNYFLSKGNQKDKQAIEVCEAIREDTEDTDSE